jgi:methionyl-tRNA formyltransferase
MRVVVFGSGEFAIPTLRSIAADGHEIVGVVSRPDHPRGRGKTSQPTPLKAAAVDMGFDVLTPPDVNAPEVIRQMRRYGADLAYVAAFGQKIGEAVRSLFPVAIVNLHGSLLPALRGAAPVQWAVINGDHHAGVTVFRLVEKMDAGPILVQRRTTIGDDETADELHDRLARIGCDAVRAALELLEADPKAPGTPQDASLATTAPKLRKEDGRIRFDVSARGLARRVCGLWPWPGALCEYRSADGARRHPVTLARARCAPIAVKRPPAARPGTLDDILHLWAGDGLVEILEIKPAGGRCMSWQDFVNGRHVKPGDGFFLIDA